MIVSSFEVLLQPIGPSSAPGPLGADLAPDAVPENAPKAGDVVKPGLVPPELAGAPLPFTVPTALQGYFLYLYNNSGNPASGIRVSFVSEDPKVMAAQSPTISGFPAFLAITNAQPPLLSGNDPTISGITFGGLTASGNVAYTDVPTIPASGTILVGLIPNYLDPSLVKSGPVARGVVDIRSRSGDVANMNISAQTRVTFFEPYATTSGMDTSEAAYSLPSPTGGSAFTFSGY